MRYTIKTFSLSHFHHIFEDRKQGLVLRESLATRSTADFCPLPHIYCQIQNLGFQMLYTYLFGLYATYIFFTTGKNGWGNWEQREKDSEDHKS